MANPLVEQLLNLESGDKFRNASEEDQRGARERFVAKRLEVDPKFLALTEDVQERIRDNFLNRPFPKPPLTAARAVEIGIQSVAGLPEPLTAILPVIGPTLGLASKTARRFQGEDFFSPTEPRPATPDELSQLDPDVAQFLGTLARVRLGLEEGNFALGGLVPPVQRLLRDRFATQEELVQAIEDAGGISEVRSAITGIAASFAGAGTLFIAGQKALKLVETVPQLLKRFGITEGGASGLFSVLAGTGFGIGESIGAAETASPAARDPTGIPFAGPAFGKIAELAGPPDPETGLLTNRQRVVIGGFGGLLGGGTVGVAVAIGRAGSVKVKTPVDETKPQVDVTPEIKVPIVDRVSKAGQMSSKEARDAVDDFYNGRDMSEDARQTVISALDIVDDARMTPGEEAAKSYLAKENSFRQQEPDDLDVLKEVPSTTRPLPREKQEPIDPERLTEEVGGTVKGEEVSIHFVDAEGRAAKTIKYNESTIPRFRDMEVGRAMQRGGDDQLRKAVERMVVLHNAGFKLKNYTGRDTALAQKVKDAARIRAGDIFDLPDPRKVATARKISVDVQKQLDLVQTPLAVGKTGAGRIVRVPSMSEAKRVIQNLQNKGFDAEAVRTNGQSDTFHVIWNIRNDSNALKHARKLAKKSAAPPTLRTPDGSKAGLTPKEQAGLKAGETSSDAAAAIFDAPELQPRKPRAKKQPAIQEEVELPAAVVSSLGREANRVGMNIATAANVIEVADKAGVTLRRFEYGKGRIIPDATTALNEAASLIAKIRSRAIDPDILRTQSIIAKTIDNTIDELDIKGSSKQSDRILLAADIARNLDMSLPDARNNLNALRGALVKGKTIGERFSLDTDPFINKVLGDQPGRFVNTLEAIVASLEDPLARRAVAFDFPAPTPVPRLSPGAQDAIKMSAQGQYVDDVNVLKQNMKEIDKMISSGEAATFLKATADELSIVPSRDKPISSNPMQGQKITASVRPVGHGSTERKIVVHDVALKTTQTYPYNANGVVDAVNYVLSGPRRLGGVTSLHGWRGPIQTGEGKISVINDTLRKRLDFPSFEGAIRWMRTLGHDSRSGIGVELPADVPLSAIGNWGAFSMTGGRGASVNPLELATSSVNTIPALRQFAGFFDPIKPWFQAIQNKFPESQVFTQIWEPVEAGARVAKQWLTPKSNEAARLSKRVKNDAAEGMQVIWMSGLHNKNISAEVKRWYSLTDDDIAKGQQFRRDIIEAGNDHGLNMDDFMQNQYPRVMQAHGLIDEAFPNEIPKEALFFRGAFREDEVSARHIDIRDLSQRLLRVMAKETFLRPALDQAERMMRGGINKMKGLEGPVRQYLDAHASKPPQSRLDLDRAVSELYVGTVTAVNNLVVKRIGTTKMEQAISRHLERVDSVSIANAFGNWMLQNVYGALMAWRAGVVIRNMTQGLMTILPRVGPKAYALGLRDTMTLGGWDAPRLAGAIDEVTPVAFADEISEAISKLGRGSAVGKLFNATQAFTETGLVAFSAVDRGHRATAYHAMKHLIQASRKAAPDVWSRSTNPRLRGTPRSVLEEARLADVSEAIGIDMFGPIVRKQADAMLARGEVNNLVSYLGRNLAEDTQWIYRKGNQAGIGRGTAGKVFFNFSTWPTWFLRYAINLTTQGTKRNRIKAIATFVAVNEGLFLTGREVFGVDASHWLYWHPLNYAGGTNFEAVLAAVQAGFLETPNNQETFEQRRARAKLERWLLNNQVPGIGGVKDLMRFLSAKRFTQGLKKGTGFPEAGPETRSSLIAGPEALINILLPESAEVDLGGRPGLPAVRRDPVLEADRPPLP